MFKQCAKCKGWKLITEFNKNKSKKDGRNCHCRSCTRAAYQAYASTNHERLLEAKRASNKRYNAAHPGRIAELSRKWRQDHPEQVKETKRKRREKDLELIRERQRRYDKKYSQANLEKVREGARKRIKGWRADHPDKLREYARNRRAWASGNGGTITEREWEDLKRKYNYTCLCCKRQEPEIELTHDHVKPLAMGGENTIQNSQPLCASCNSSKGAKHIDYRPQWEGRLFWHLYT